MDTRFTKKAPAERHINYYRSKKYFARWGFFNIEIIVSINISPRWDLLWNTYFGLLKFQRNEIFIGLWIHGLQKKAPAERHINYYRSKKYFAPLGLL
jgi:hypothetical protein